MNQKDTFTRELLRSWVTLNGTYLQRPVLTAKIDLARELNIIDETEADMIISAVLAPSGMSYGEIQDILLRTLEGW